MMRIFYRLSLLCLMTTVNVSCAEQPRPLNLTPTQQANFIQQATSQEKLTVNDVKQALSKATYQPIIIDKMTKPAEGKPYGDYRKLLLSQKRIDLGKAFIKEHSFAFNEAKRKYGVPPEMIASILGVETYYGKNTGNFRVLDALATLSFGYPRRAEFFQQELTKYIYLSNRNHWPVEKLLGSYAGAFGWTQFMPSSYLRFAVSAYPGAEPDLNNPNDAILSIGNYFKENGWEHGGLVAIRVKLAPNTCKQLICDQRKRAYSVATWRKHGVAVPAFVPGDEKANMVQITMDSGKENWMAFHNFYVITRYNNSVNYAMAAYELSQALKAPPR